MKKLNFTLTALFLFGLPAVLLRFFLPSLAFHPTREVEHTPRDAGLAFEEVWLTTSDGVRLNAWYVPAENARGTMLFFSWQRRQSGLARGLH